MVWKGTSTCCDDQTLNTLYNAFECFGIWCPNWFAKLRTLKFKVWTDKVKPGEFWSLPSKSQREKSLCIGFLRVEAFNRIETDWKKRVEGDWRADWSEYAVSLSLVDTCMSTCECQLQAQWHPLHNANLPASAHSRGFEIGSLSKFKLKRTERLFIECRHESKRLYVLLYVKSSPDAYQKRLKCLTGSDVRPDVRYSVYSVDPTRSSASTWYSDIWKMADRTHQISSAALIRKHQEHESLSDELHTHRQLWWQL